MPRPRKAHNSQSSATTSVNGSAAREKARPAVSRAEIDVALGHIQRHACDGLTPGRVVMETQQVSLATFSKHFLAATGLTLRAAIRQRQLEEARRLLLRTELTPPFIAEHCGFRDLRSMASAFTEAGCEVPHAVRSPNGSSSPPSTPRKPPGRQRN
jgi:AraC-like DNA-binding protein